MHNWLRALAYINTSNIQENNVRTLACAIERMCFPSLSIVISRLRSGVHKELANGCFAMSRSHQGTERSEKALGDAQQHGRSIHSIKDIGGGAGLEQAVQAAGERHHLEKQQARVAFDLIGDAVIGIDPGGKVNYINAMAERMVGWTCKEALNQPVEKVFKVIDAVSRQPAECSGLRAVRHDAKVELAARNLLVCRHGREVAIEDSAAPVHNRSGQVTGAVVVFHDVRFSRVTAAKMAHQAQHDWLTGLPNRAALADRLNHALGLARRHDKQVGLLFIDLDNFKQINDTFGHARGDQLLATLSRRLADCVRETDTVSRYGGDEFVIVLSEIEQPEDAHQVTRKLREAVSGEQLIDDQAWPLSVSVGVSIYPDDGGDIDMLLKKADRAMYKDKARKAFSGLESM